MNDWPWIAPVIGFSLILVLGFLRSREKHRMKKT